MGSTLVNPVSSRCCSMLMPKDPSAVFSTFQMDQVANIYRHCWKGYLKFGKVAKFESDGIETNKDMAPQSRKVL